MPSSETKNIVIIGGGIIGCTSAYFLTRHPSYDAAKHKIILLEASSQVAGGASGKAGGLLALFAYPSNIVPLSFRLHAELAAEHNGASRWGYRPVSCGQIEARGRPVPATSQTATSDKEKNLHDGEGQEHVSLQKRDAAALKRLRAAGFPADLDWVADESARAYEAMSDEQNSAQVHPLHFTRSMAELAAERGVEVRTGAHVDKILESEPEAAGATPHVRGVRYTDASSGTEHTVDATHVVLAAGPWTQRLHAAAPIEGLRAHSVTIKPTRSVSAYALFTSIDLPAGKRTKHVAPEIYARPFDEVYACGDGDTTVPLPRTTDDVEVDLARCQDIFDQVGSISDELRGGTITARQACYLPVVSGSGGPFIGEMRQCRGLVLAAGHTCWGIQNGPGTGKLVSEIVMDGKATSARLGQLDPAKVL